MMPESEMLPKTTPRRLTRSSSQRYALTTWSWGERDVEYKRSDAEGAVPSVAGPRVSWRTNTATVAADSIDVFHAGVLECALGW